LSRNVACYDEISYPLGLDHGLLVNQRCLHPLLDTEPEELSARIVEQTPQHGPQDTGALVFDTGSDLLFLNNDGVPYLRNLDFDRFFSFFCL
jgi:hypothetical protein